ncbi:MAG: LytTR family transcriptional regulator [Coriobacteriales bacterium]|nr:LytTR family transcriptional regulator [Coriobacteriales bacterium]
MGMDVFGMSRDFVERLWAGDVECCVRLLDDEFSFVGPFSGPLGTGPQQIADFCARSRPVARMLRFHIQGVRDVYSDARTSVVLLVGQATSDGSDSSHSSFRCTFVWHMVGDGARLAHLHASVPMLVAALDGVHELGQMGQHDALAAEAKTPSDPAPVVLRDTNGQTHILGVRQTTYLESLHQYTLVHGAGVPAFKVRASLTSLLMRFPAYFVRVHRSYAVNSLLVRSISGSEIRLSDGSRVPIPVKRATQVKSDVLQAMTDALSNQRAHEV